MKTVEHSISSGIRITAIIPAAGRGSRLGSAVPKQFVEIEGKPIIIHSLSVLDKVPMISDIIVSALSAEIPLIKKLIMDYNINKVVDVVEGGRERNQSVRNAFNKIKSTDYVLIHDAVRPLITEQAVTELINTGISYRAAISAIPVTDTVKFVDKDNILIKNVDRKGLWLAQTPQIFKYDTLSEAYKLYDRHHTDVTDEAGIVELGGTKIKIVAGSVFNIKITTKADLRLAELIVRMQ